MTSRERITTILSGGVPIPSLSRFGLWVASSATATTLPRG